MPVSFSVDDDMEGALIQVLEDAGFDVEPGNSPMVDWRVSREGTDDTR